MRYVALDNMQVSLYNVHCKRNLHIYISAQYASCQEGRKLFSGKESALRASYHSIKENCNILQENCKEVLTTCARCGMTMLQEVARVTSRRETKVMAEEYVLARTPDLLRLGELVTRAKGPSRTMAQFAEDCGIGASTLSRIANGKITKAVSLENLQAIYDHRDESVELPFETFARADGYVSPREYTFLRRRGSLEDLRQAEQTAQNIITLSLLNRGITLKRISPATLFREDFPRVRPSLGLDLKCEIGERRWLFFYVLAECAEDGERSVSPLTSSAEHMAYNALTMRSSLFLLDAWYPEKLDDTRSTIVFRDAKLFDAAVELLRRRPIQTAMSVMLLDFDEGRIVKEQWISQGLEKSARFQSSSAPVPTSAPDSVPSLVPCSSPIGHLSIIFSASFNKSSRSSEVNVLYSTSSLAGRRISQPPA